MATILFQEFIDPFQPGSFVIRTEYYMRYVFARHYIQRHRRGINTIYDLGCGNGYGMSILKETAKTLIGLDKSEELLKELKQKHIPQSTYAQIDFDTTQLRTIIMKEKLPTPDGIIAFEIIEHVEDPAGLLQQLYSLLPKHGVLIASVPNERYEPKKKGKPRNEFHKHLFSTDKIHALLQEAGFSEIRFYGQPYPNRLYHAPKIIGKMFDLLTNTIPFTFAPLANLIATPQKNRHEDSYSILFTVTK